MYPLIFLLESSGNDEQTDLKRLKIRIELIDLINFLALSSNFGRIPNEAGLGFLISLKQVLGYFIPLLQSRSVLPYMCSMAVIVIVFHTLVPKYDMSLKMELHVSKDGVALGG